jgi:DNA polymerase I
MTGKNIISPVRKTYPPIDALLTYRQIRKQLETYGEGWALFVDPDTSRIHSTFNVFGALTGRASNSQPNLQQLPKRQPIKGLASYRSLIVAGPGNVLVDVDYDQMELRILAALSRDSAMLAVFAREDEIGRDLHRATAGRDAACVARGRDREALGGEDVLTLFRLPLDGWRHKLLCWPCQ